MSTSEQLVRHSFSSVYAPELTCRRGLRVAVVGSSCVSAAGGAAVES